MRTSHYLTETHATALGWMLACLLTLGPLAGAVHDHTPAEVPDACVLCTHAVGDDLQADSRDVMSVTALAGTAYLLPTLEPAVESTPRDLSARGPPTA